MRDGGGRAFAKRIIRTGLPIPRVLRPVIRGCYRCGVGCVEALAFVRKLIWIEPVLRSVCERVGQGLRAERLPYMRGHGDLKIGDNVNLSGRSCFYFIHNVSERPGIEIGSHTFIGNGCTFSAGKRIVVGDHCLISALVRIHDNDGHPLDPERRRNNEPIGDAEVAEVIIEDNVWIGAEAKVMKGVRVGRDAVVGAGAVVTSDVPPCAVVAGNPAKVVKRLDATDTP